MKDIVVKDKSIYTKREYPQFEPIGKKIDSLCEYDMSIVIPTLGRESKQYTFSQIPGSLRDRTFLATKESSFELLKKHNSGAHILVLPEQTTGIADTRQKCIDLLPKGKVWMIDDTVKFQKRNEEHRALGWSTPEEIEELYDLVSHMLDFYPQVGISDRPGNNREDSWKKDIARSYTIYGLRTDVFEKESICFDEMYKKYGVYFYEDYYLTLSLFKKGYANTVVYDFLSSVPGRNKKGGNSSFRTNERLKNSIECLQKEFPGFVKMKETVSNWNGLEGIRYEPQISWKKAFESYSKTLDEKNILLF